MGNINLTQIFSSALVLLSIIDIVGSVPIILQLRSKGREVNALKATLYSAIVMVGFYYGGYWILEIFNCNIQSFATAGGFLMFLMALEMILDVEIFKNNTPAGGATIVPMVFPLIAGAGVLTTLISLKAMYDDVNILIGLAINMLWVFIVIKSTTKVQRLLGEGGIFFLRKFFGIILLAMSVKMMTENIAKLF
ncbi:MAG: MarC family protein [Muribaculaceae bacterium]|nr:MarC family protein [Muribaculaceae bacterium]MBQ2561843.1 MarC family protein [Muribaculaceae bacterium]MBQ5508885.1 MarC family protein [Muribaculaceae bacterium]MDY6294660.1 MarC family protein [Bacteroidales bacterium]MDY6413042.1 MarC family protein [Bacteroidales bacterium]